MATEQKAETVAQAAQRLRDIWSLGEGPQVEDALYKYGTCEPSKATTFEAEWSDVLRAFHKVNIDDQFVPPIVRVDKDGKPVGTIKDGDVLVYFDFRTDRAKPLTASFLDIPFGGQVGGLSEEVIKTIPKITMVTMTHYDDNFNKSSSLLEAFNPAEPLENTYAEVAGANGVDQLIAAETEKWRAVTWFKDGRRNLGYEKKEDDGLVRTDCHPKLPITVRVIPSRKVAAHIQAPKMRAKEITDVLLDGVKRGVTDIFANYANADMVGHAMTDLENFKGVVEAILELDTHLGRLVPEAVKAGYTVFITGDHGNAEEMIHGNGKANPAHTTNKVPFIVVGLGKDEKLTLRDDTTIGDMAPCVLQLRGIEKPPQWDRNTAFVGDAKPSKMRKIMRLILDGYGVNDDAKGNAMAAAAEEKKSPLWMDEWMKGKDGAIACRAEASGPRCGYPKGEAGTTEFGHVLFDAGRMVHSDVTLIDHALETGKFDSNPQLLKAFNGAKERNATVHFMGVLSDGGVHSSLKHLDALMRMAKSCKLEKLSLHPISDGRDVAGDSSPEYFKWLADKIKEYGVGQINSVWGRGWGKDRDNRWKRIETAFRSLVEGTAAVHLQLPAAH